MDLAMTFSQINWLSIFIATFCGFFVLGGLWYGPIFGQAWMKEFGFSEKDLATRNMSKVFGLSFLLALIAAINLSMFIGPDAGLMVGLMAGFFAGFGWVATLLGILYLFEKRSLKAFLINAGYCVFSLTLMGAILGAMSNKG